VILCVNFLDYPLQDTVLVKYECPSDGAHHRLAIHLLLSPGSERLKHLCGRIREQRERQVILVSKLPVRRRTVLAHSYDIISLCNQGSMIVTEIASLSSTSACIILRIEIYDCSFTCKVLLRNLVAILIHNLEIRHPVTYIQHNFNILKPKGHQQTAQHGY